MLPTTPRNTRLIVISVIVLAAILMVALVPFIGFDMVNPIVQSQLDRIEQFKAEGNPQWPLFTLTTWLVSFFYPFWSVMSLVAGLT
ncbi:MAG: hypothetical protein ACLFWD_11820, partial [Anaerolineales bacterium]